jgi:hypothetical protein
MLLAATQPSPSSTPALNQGGYTHYRCVGLLPRREFLRKDKVKDEPMKTIRPWLNALSLVLLIIFISSATLAQSNALPPELNQQSSLSEILSWLDQKGFPQARIGVIDPGSPTYESGGMLEGPEPSTKLVLSQGFRLVQTDNCHLTLRNEAAIAISFSSKSHDSELATLFEHKGGSSPQPRVVHLIVWLEKLSHTKNKTPRLHTRDPEQAKLLGAWRTKFTYKGFFGRNFFSLAVDDSSRGMKEVLTSEAATFTFDNRELSKQFTAALHLAIRICKEQ